MQLMLPVHLKHLQLILFLFLYQFILIFCCYFAFSTIHHTYHLLMFLEVRPQSDLHQLPLLFLIDFWVSPKRLVQLEY